MAEPILTWAGGKRQLLDRIMQWLPPKGHFDRYFEPFFGGGAVFFALEPSNGFINDLNPRLMNFYQQFRERPEQVIAENKQLDDELLDLSEDGQKERYYELRKEFNNLRSENGRCKDPYREAILFLFLNRTCWNGLYRTNEDGEFNVPMGSNWTRTEGIQHRFRDAYRALQDTIIDIKDFAYVENHVQENDLVFFDPPYPGASQTAQFKEYNPEGFDESQQRNLRELALKLDRRGAYVIITNGASAEEIYKESEDFDSAFVIERVEARRSINSDETKRKGIGETDIIVSNFSPFTEQQTFDDFVDLDKEV